jgi:hypothetical protein
MQIKLNEIKPRETGFQEFLLMEDTLNDLNLKLNGIKPKVVFGFNGNSSNSSNKYIFISGISLDYGRFPSELNLKLTTETQLKNGVTDDKISELFISYDHHPKLKKAENRSNLEDFVFVSRYSDDYLGIDEKYELGVGIVINYWSKKHLTETGSKNYSSIKRLSAYEPSQTLKNNWKHKEELENLEQSNIKKYSRLRFAFLLGFFYELEKIAFKDSIPTASGKVPYQCNFDGTAQLKWEIRPTMKINFSDEFSLDLKCYFKMPFPGKFLNTVEFDTIADTRFDCFIDFPITLTYKVNKNMELGINYRLMYNNAPRRRYIMLNDAYSPFLLMPDQRHQSVNLTFTFIL